MDYREKYAGEKACATCKHVRSFLKSITIHDDEKLIPYNGGREARCALHPMEHIYMFDEPHLDLPNSDCWEQEEADHANPI